MYKQCWVALAFIFMVPVANAQTVQDKLILQKVIDKLDVTSFNNSIGPRREKAKITFKDYGVSSIKLGAGEAIVSEPDNSWKFVIILLDNTPNQIKICLEDQALNGGSYHTQNAYLLTPDQSGFLKASAVDDPYCSNMPRD